MTIHASAEKKTRLEDVLTYSLSPVIPDPIFVSRLYYRLTEKPAVTLEKGSTNFLVLVVVCIGLFTGTLLTWLVSRIRNTSKA
jgi:hypothetical protein